MYAPVGRLVLTLSLRCATVSCFFFFFQAEDGIRDLIVTGVQTCALPIVVINRSYFESLNSHLDNNGFGIEAGGSGVFLAGGTISGNSTDGVRVLAASEAIFSGRQSPPTAGSVSW